MLLYVAENYAVPFRHVMSSLSDAMDKNHDNNLL